MSARAKRQRRTGRFRARNQGPDSPHPDATSARVRRHVREGVPAAGRRADPDRQQPAAVADELHSALTQASRASGSKGSIRILGQRQQPPPPRSGTPTPAPDQSPRVRGQIGAPPCRDLRPLATSPSGARVIQRLRPLLATESPGPSLMKRQGSRFVATYGEGPRAPGPDVGVWRRYATGQSAPSGLRA